MGHASFTARIYYEDTDAGGVVYYANYLRFCERARTEWLREKGVEQSDLWQQQGIGFVVKHCAVDYHFPARLDDVLTINTEMLSHTATSLTMKQRVFVQEKPCVTLEVKLVCVDNMIRPCKIPVSLLTLL